MSDPVPTVLLIAGIVTVGVLITVFILIIPLRISLSFISRNTETKGILAGSWFIIGFEVFVSGKDQQISVMIAGARLMTRSLSSFRAPTKKPSGIPGPGQIPGIIFSLLSLQGPVIGAFLDLIRHTRFDYARGTARIGLGDPSATGMLYGLYWAVRPLLPVNRISFSMIPEFNQEVCEIDLSTRFHVTYPIRVIVHAVKIIKNPAVRKAMKTFRKKPGKVAA